MRIEFRRCNDDGTLAGGGNRGIRPNIFDPRATTCHDGREAGIHVNFIQKAQFDPEKKAAVENAAAWETEPKENVDLDIYYEASNAIPMFLTSENTLNFAPYNCKVKLRNSNNPPELINPNISFSDHYVAYVGQTEEAPIIGIRATHNDSGQSGYYALTSDFNTNQHLVFVHPDGTEMYAKITQYMIPLDGDGN